MIRISSIERETKALWLVTFNCKEQVYKLEVTESQVELFELLMRLDGKPSPIDSSKFLHEQWPSMPAESFLIFPVPPPLLEIPESEKAGTRPSLASVEEPKAESWRDRPAML